MKRGFTKRLSSGRASQEQKEERDRIRSINYHLSKGNMGAALRLLNKTTEGNKALKAKLTADLAKEKENEV